MLPGQHARLHARFAALLEERPELAGRTRPRWRSPTTGRRRTTSTRRSAGRSAAAESGSAAHVETLKMYERALELWDQVPDRRGHRRTARRRARPGGAAAAGRRRDRARPRAGQRRPGRDRARRRARAGSSGSASVGELRCTLMRPGSVEAVEEAVAHAARPTRRPRSGREVHGASWPGSGSWPGWTPIADAAGGRRRGGRRRVRPAWSPTPATPSAPVWSMRGQEDEGLGRAPPGAASWAATTPARWLGSTSTTPTR